jgi:hypothetical protein
MPTRVDEGDEVVLPDAKCTRMDLYSTLRAMMDLELDESKSAAELLAEELNHDREPVAKFELRYGHMQLSERGLVGRVSVQELRDHVKHIWEQDVLGRIKRDQPDVQWALVGARVSRSDAIATEFVEAKGVDSAAIADAQAQGRKEGALGKASKIYTTVPDFWINLDVAFAGYGGSLVDQHYNITGLIATPFQAYLKTRELRHLPRALRRQRMLAGKIIAYTREAPAVIEAEAEPTRDLVDAQIQVAAMLWKSGDKKWKDIGELFGVSGQKVKAAVEKAGLLEVAP